MLIEIAASPPCEENLLPFQTARFSCGHPALEFLRQVNLATEKETGGKREGTPG